MLTMVPQRDPMILLSITIIIGYGIVARRGDFEETTREVVPPWLWQFLRDDGTDGTSPMPQH